MRLRSFFIPVKCRLESCSGAKGTVTASGTTCGLADPKYRAVSEGKKQVTLIEIHGNEGGICTIFGGRRDPGASDYYDLPR